MIDNSKRKKTVSEMDCLTVNRHFPFIQKKLVAAVTGTAPASTEKYKKIENLHPSWLSRRRFGSCCTRGRNGGVWTGTSYFPSIRFQGQGLHRRRHRCIPTWVNLRRTFRRSNCYESPPWIWQCPRDVDASYTTTSIRRSHRTRSRTVRFRGGRRRWIRLNADGAWQHRRVWQIPLQSIQHSLLERPPPPLLASNVHGRTVDCSTGTSR